MSDKMLDRFTRPEFRTGGDPSADNIGDESLDCGAFGFLRGLRDRALMLELRKKDGTVRAIGYAWLQMVEFDPSSGIVLSFPGSRIQLIGRNLNAEVRPGVRLFEGITRNRVPFVQEAGEVELMQAIDGVTIIERIEW
ncbi:MAG: hypothetical protein ACK5Q5_04280 [Planctomycetaceae bacterium]